MTEPRTPSDVNEHGVDMRLIKVGVTVRFDSPPATGTVVRMDLPRLGVFQQADGERAIFHSLNVTGVEAHPAENTPGREEIGRA